MDKIELPTHISGDWWNGMGPITVKVNGTPMNITNTEIRMQIRKGRRPTDTVLEEWSTVNNTIEINDGPNGVFTILGRTLTLPSGNLFSDVQITTSDNRQFTIIPEIIWRVMGDITR